MEHSPEFERIKNLYINHKITEKGLTKAVALGVITEAEKEEILSINV